MMNQSAGPPVFPQTADNWKLTPMSDEQFAFIYTSVISQREEKAALINGRKDAVPEIPVEQIPVLTWASPKEFERIMDYAKKKQDERDEARLVAGALHALAVNLAGHTKVNQTILDALSLNERLIGVTTLTPSRYPPPESQQPA